MKTKVETYISTLVAVKSKKTENTSNNCEISDIGVKRVRYVTIAMYVGVCMGGIAN